MGWKLLAAGTILAIVTLCAYKALSHPVGTTNAADLVSEFHGTPTKVGGYPGEDPAELKLIRDNMSDYAFSVPVQEVKSALLDKLRGGGWTIFDTGVEISFRRKHGSEFGFFSYDRNLFPKEPPGTTCVLSIFKGANIANSH